MPVISAGELDTFPRLLLHHAARRGDSPALREKDLGIWQTWTWGQVLDEVRAFAGGLTALGVRRGDHLAIIGGNRPRLYWALAAAQVIGAIPVPLYQEALAQELVFPLRDADIAVVVVEDQEQLDKVVEILPRCPRLRHIIYDDPRGLRHREDCDERLLGFEQVQKLGTGASADHSFEREIAAGRPSDTAAMFYTSGTTGAPKGVVLTHGNLIEAARPAIELDQLTDEEEVLAYLPPAWIGQNIFSYVQSLITGYCVSCPESGDTVLIDMREVGPTFYFAPPPVLEGILTRVMIRMEDASWIKRKLFRYFMALARRVGAKLLAHERGVGLLERLLYALGDLMVYGPLRNVLGMSRVRVAYTAGEAIGPDLFVFYRSIGINLKQLYGSTETSVFVCMQPDDAVKPDTVGPPVKGVQVDIAENGEILIRSPGLFKEYYKNPEATAQAKDQGGWFHTGDAGFFDDAGHLRIVDRARDVGRLEDGTMFAPKYLENKLKFFPHIKEAVAFGDGRSRVTAMVNIDMAAVGDWAERRNLPYSGYIDLAGKPAVYELLCDCLAQVNRDLSRDPHLAGSQIARFVVLPKDLDADDGELTRSRKVRRGIIADKYAKIIAALYSDAARVELELQMRFEDGRCGKIDADLQIWNVPTFARDPAVRP